MPPFVVSFNKLMLNSTNCSIQPNVLSANCYNQPEVFQPEVVDRWQEQTEDTSVCKSLAWQSSNKIVETIVLNRKPTVYS